MSGDVPLIIATGRSDRNPDAAEDRAEELRVATEAVRWYGRAAEQGSLAAQLALGRHHAESPVGAPDRVAAHMWLSLAMSEA